MNVYELIKTVSGEASSLSGDFKELSKIRLELLKIEATELANEIKKKLISAIILTVTLFFTVCVILSAGISAIGIILKPYLPKLIQPYSWQCVALIVVFIFIVIVFVFLNILKAKPKAPFFAYTKQELKSDKQWLQNLTNKKNKS